MFSTSKYYICRHNCHKVVDPLHSRKGVMMNIHVFNTDSSGSVIHRKTHTCGAEGVPKCKEGNHERLTDDEWVIFAHRLWSTKRGTGRDLISQRYREAWQNLKVPPYGESTAWIPAEHPDEAPFLSNGAPVDFVPNGKFRPRRHIAWLERFRMNTQ